MSENIAKNQLSICFYGSSGDSETLDLLKDELLKTEISDIVTAILSLDYKRFKVVTGGYHGIMFLIAKTFKDNATKFNKSVQTVGITCDAYDLEDINSPSYNQYNAINNVNDIIIQAESFPARIQAMIESADVFVMLKGKQGTLSEFLMTAETYGFTIEMLKHKNVKLLVDVFWKPLITNKTFFREFKNIIFFDNTEEIKASLINFKANENVYLSPEYLESNKVTEGAFLNSSFQNYCAAIDKILYGKISESGDLKKNLGYHGNILAIDFGYILDQLSKPSKGEFITNSTKQYMKLLNRFFNKNNSIMLNKEHNEGFKVKYFNGAVVENPELKCKQRNIIPQYSAEKNEAEFSDWAKFFEKRDYGQTLIWRGICQKGEQDSFKLNLSIFLLFNCYLPSRKIEKIRQLTDDFFLMISTRKIVDLFKEKEIDLQNHARKAAISQVMARNMSHNIGSHVLSRIIDTETITDFIHSSKAVNLYQSIGLHTNDNEAKNPVRLITAFNSYMKSRMDFLADITTGVPTIENSKWFYKEILSGFDKNRVLLNRISGINEFHFKIEARNYVDREDDKDRDNTLIKESDVGDNYYIQNDLMVSVPNDILGCHALYIIFENIIRNTAKHSDIDSNGKTKENPAKIFIDIKERPEEECNELYEVLIYDNNSLIKPFEIRDTDEKEKYLPYFASAEIKESKISLLKKIVVDQNIRLNQSVLQKNGGLRQGAWGLIEMNASAAYLRKIPVEKIDDGQFDIDARIRKNNNISHYNSKTGKTVNILKAVSASDKYLGYRLFLYKPREILIIDCTNFLGNIKLDDKKTLLKTGVLYTNGIEKENSVFRYDDKKIYNHKLVLIIAENPEDIFEKNSTGLTERTIKLTVEQAAACEALSFLKNNPEKFKNELWKFYILNSKYEFYNAYDGLYDKSPIIKRIKNADSEGSARFFDHGKGYLTDESIFKEIIYSAVESFMPKSSADEITIIKHLDSVHSKIVIIDERIQEYCDKGFYNAEISVKKIYKSTNIFIPSIESDQINLSGQNFDGEFINIINFIHQQRDATFFVFHLGVIEKLIASNNRLPQQAKHYDKDKGEHIKDFLSDIICKPNIMAYNRIIIISGRGTPHNLPTDVRYLNYSIVSQYMIDIRFKYLLSEAILSARRIK